MTPRQISLDPTDSLHREVPSPFAASWLGRCVSGLLAAPAIFTAGRFFQVGRLVSKRLWRYCLFSVLSFISFGLVKKPPGYNLPVMLRKILEELGGTLIKFGQILAMRPDVIPKEYVIEFSALLDAVPPFPGEDAMAIVEQELGVPLKDIVQSFDKDPIAAASFAQVHTATLINGERVVVKVQRPGLRKVVDADTRIVVGLATVLDFLGVFEHTELRLFSEEFRDWTEEELDLRIEAAYAQRLRDATGADSNIYIPRVHWEYTTRCVMTMEFLDGLWISQIFTLIDTQGRERTRLDLAQRSVDLDLVAANILDNQLRQMFEHNLFHADPHAGNLLILANNVIGYVDFGITGQLDSEFRSTQLLLYDALQRRDYGQYLRAIYRLIKPPIESMDLHGFEYQVRKNAAAWQNALHNPYATLQERSSSWLFMRILKEIRKYGIEVPRTALRYYRAFSMIELMVLQLSPRFDIVKAISEYLVQAEVRELRLEMRIEAQLMKLIENRRLFRDGLASLRRTLNFGDRSDTITRLRPSRWRLALSGVSRLIAMAAILVLVLLPFNWNFLGVMHAWSTRLGTLRMVEILGGICLLGVWAARRLSISSARNGALVRQHRA
jgi:ubiquinone biosynthesis protein